MHGSEYRDTMLLQILRMDDDWGLSPKQDILFNYTKVWGTLWKRGQKDWNSQRNNFFWTLHNQRTQNLLLLQLHCNRYRPASSQSWMLARLSHFFLNYLKVIGSGTSINIFCNSVSTYEIIRLQGITPNPWSQRMP